MEQHDTFTEAHDEFFGNIVGSIVKTIKATTIKTESFITEWTIPNPS